MRQLIIARKDLHMSSGKLAAQVCHASMAFVSNAMLHGTKRKESVSDDQKAEYEISMKMDADTYEQWFCGIFTKTICEAKNRNQLMKAVAMAEELGLKENEDFFLIKDFCYTEIEPEEIDENGNGRTLTCIGFRPLPDEIAHSISKKYQLYA